LGDDARAQKAHVLKNYSKHLSLSNEILIAAGSASGMTVSPSGRAGARPSKTVLAAPQDFSVAALLRNDRCEAFDF
jgi:hypothetical protein